jgi:hypothetical protein
MILYNLINKYKNTETHLQIIPCLIMAEKIEIFWKDMRGLVGRLRKLIRFIIKNRKLSYHTINRRR